MDRLATCGWNAPLGHIRITSDGHHVLSLTIFPSGEEVEDGPPPAVPLLVETVTQLRQWFAGERQQFDLPLRPSNTTRGQVLRDTIAAIPYGETASYGHLARLAGSGPRAIGQACRRNPLPIIIPCHRVIAAHGEIGHYSGGDGVATKAWLLNFEQILQQRNMP